MPQEELKAIGVPYILALDCEEADTNPKYSANSKKQKAVVNHFESDLWVVFGLFNASLNLKFLSSYL